MIPQLRTRTEYSYRSCYGPVTRVAEVLAELGTPAAGIVDTAGTWGHVDWERELTAAGVAPLYGTEFVMPQEDGRKPRCWVLAEDLAAFYRLSSANPTEPQALAQATGVVRFAGAALTDPETFDYVDINPRSRRQGMRALALARSTGKPLVLTSDNDFPGIADRDRFLAWDDSKKMTPQHILSERELRAALHWMDDATFATALANTHEVAERCSGLKLARAPMISVEGDLRELVEAGRKYRLERGHIAQWTEEYAARLERELLLIEQKGYESYFKVVADMVQWAKQRMLVGPARGCFLPDQRVHLPNAGGGERRTPISEIKRGQHVIDGFGKRVPVKEVFEYEVDEEIVELEFDDGSVLKCTTDHKVLTHDGWVEAGKLEPHHIVCTDDPATRIARSKMEASGWPLHLAHKAKDGMLEFTDIPALPEKAKGGKARVWITCEVCDQRAVVQMKNLFGRTSALKGRQVCADCASAAASRLPECRKRNSEAQLIAQSSLEARVKNAAAVSWGRGRVVEDLSFGFPGYKAAVVALYDNKCASCDLARDEVEIDLDLHHIDGDRAGNSCVSNLILLCKACHTRFHNFERYQPKTAAKLRARYERIARSVYDEATEVKEIHTLLRESVRSAGVGR